MGDFKKMVVWQKARALNAKVYALTGFFPADERYGLTSQVRRASVSISANIAEGRGRRTDADFRRFIDIALGSAYELECLLILARDVIDDLCGGAGHVDLESTRESLSEVRAMLSALSP